MVILINTIAFIFRYSNYDFQSIYDATYVRPVKQMNKTSFYATKKLQFF